jgi:hypothetical protein
MNFKLLNTVVIGLVLSASSLVNIANAGIIDNGSYTTVDGLDWLDWTATVSMTQVEAIAANSGWHGANAEQMQMLMNTMFDMQFIWNSNGESVQAVVDKDVKKLYFESLFAGPTFSHPHNMASPLARSVGAGLVGFGWCNGCSYLAGSEPAQSGATGVSNAWSGVALVRTSIAVPEPSTLAIFALGIIGLASRRFKKQ